MRSFSLPLVLLGAGAVVALAMILAVESVGLWVAFPAAALIGATAVTWNAVGMLALLAVSGAHSAGRASGIALSGFYSCG